MVTAYVQTANENIFLAVLWKGGFLLNSYAVKLQRKLVVIEIFFVQAECLL